MPYYDFIWTDAIVSHLAEHDVTPENFEYVVQNPNETMPSRSSGLPAAAGFSPDGRYLFCVYDKLPDGTLLPVTAYDMRPFDF